MDNNLQEELRNKVPFFDRVPLQSIGSQLNNISVKDVPSGEEIILEGERNQTLYLVLSGSLEVVLKSSNNEVINTVHEGETIGEISLLDGQPATASVIAKTACRLVELHEKELWPLVYSSHRACLNLVSILTSRMRHSTSTLNESKKKTKEMESKAVTDGLTGVFNRMWLDSMLQKTMERARHEKTAFSLLMLDIDHFKSFNDNYGHKAGDDVLKIVAKTMKDHLRPSDFLARYGGEEFTILLPATDIRDAFSVAEKLRETVSKVACSSDGKELPSITISVGVAQMSFAQTPEMLLGEGDAALYRAKEAGRNRVSE